MTLVRSLHTESFRTLSSTIDQAALPIRFVFGRTPVMQDIKRQIDSIATLNVPILLQGENGTGKSLCAQLIHQCSMRTPSSIARLNCAAVPGTLIETELFGHEKCAFAGINHIRLGKLEHTGSGTLVLDEIGCLDKHGQSKLLQILQDRSFTRVGGNTPYQISSRFISIASSNLRGQVDKGSFRADLLYRINAVAITLPPLRERREDLLDLIDDLSTYYSLQFRTTARPLSKYLVQLMHDYDWPGNIRQLDNMIRNYILFGNEDALVTELMSAYPRATQVMKQIDLNEPLSLKVLTKKATHDLERQIIIKVLQANGWNRQKTANWLQISYRSLLYKLSRIEDERKVVKRQHSLQIEHTRAQAVHHY